MDTDRFARILGLLSTTPSRHAINRALAGLAAGTIFAPPLGFARVEAKKKKGSMCRSGSGIATPMIISGARLKVYITTAARKTANTPPSAHRAAAVRRASPAVWVGSNVSAVPPMKHAARGRMVK